MAKRPYDPGHRGPLSADEQRRLDEDRQAKPATPAGLPSLKGARTFDQVKDEVLAPIRKAAGKGRPKPKR